MKVNPRSLRGVRQCNSCGVMNGNRAQLCNNAACPQNKNVLDVVSLVTLSAGSTVCSLRTKARETPRNFVVIQDVTLSLQPNAAVVSSKAVCHVETCRNASGIDCQHVKACRQLGSAIPMAQVYKVSREVLWNLNIGQEQKQQLWQQYKWAEEQEQLPAVQRLNATTFAVKCERSDSFPTARLHVTALANGVSPKKGTNACACRKLKIIVEPDNSLVMQDEICDHLLLVLAGILSSPQGKRVYGNFTNSLKTFWMPSRLETPLGEGTQEDLRLSLSMVDEFDPQVDILVFGDHLDLPLPDLSDGAFNLDSMQAATSNHSTSNSSSALIHYANDSQLLSNCDLFAEPEEQHIQLTDCNIELMDQYQPTNQIDLDIELPSEPYNRLTAPSIFSETMPAVVAEQQPSLELPAIAVVKKTIKATEIVDEVTSRKQPPLPAKRDLIVNRPSSPASKSLCVDADVQPALAYSAWLDHVIELLNGCLEPVCTTEPGLSTRSIQQSFNVHKETFSHFCKSFSAGIKRRPVHEVAKIASGKYKGLPKYVWHFTAGHTVTRIFSTSNIKIQLLSYFERHRDGYFLPYVRPPIEQQVQGQPKKRQIYTRLNLWVAKIVLETGILLSWTPDVLPRSHFGLMTVEFTVETRSPS
ncbi:uncharacterized protein C2orf42 homolog isoform X1 [Drosophila guanche]|uniref:Blast:Uncharacterized protein C2orf42 homolog n=1 Tax=Drosophila guanche TaxID=7266 RepID=A0A3B0K4E2_DROGU|nr:uncharacterized protein C2orf42 homolog isoform X1 [Drosophila guanche]SPP82860.1 blast:Uncharacterized protein C2orf42 homolog [Drosophila guanche]